jgi:hypothetical protein
MTFSFTALTRPPCPWPGMASMPTQSITTSVRAVFVGSGLALALVNSATAGPLEEGLIAYQNGTTLRCCGSGVH